MEDGLVRVGKEEANFPAKESEANNIQLQV